MRVKTKTTSRFKNTVTKIISGGLIVLSLLILASCLPSPIASATATCADGTRVPGSVQEDCSPTCFNNDANHTRVDCPPAKGGSTNFVIYSDGGPFFNRCYEENPQANDDTGPGHFGTHYTQLACSDAFGGDFSSVENPSGAAVGSNSASSTTIDRIAEAQTCTQGVENCVKTNPIFTSVLLPAVNFLSAGVGLVVVAMIIIGGIQFSTAGGDPNKVKAARNRIVNALLALLAYMFLFSFLQWLIPGGLFK